MCRLVGFPNTSYYSCMCIAAHAPLSCSRTALPGSSRALPLAPIPPAPISWSNEAMALATSSSLSAPATAIRPASTESSPLASLRCRSLSACVRATTPLNRTPMRVRAVRRSAASRASETMLPPPSPPPPPPLSPFAPPAMAPPARSVRMRRLSRRLASRASSFCSSTVALASSTGSVSGRSSGASGDGSGGGVGRRRSGAMIVLLIESRTLASRATAASRSSSDCT
mmetsp:Transcript_32178/g.69137  ORF Transcript_32178/g.69137 Transcript_32178/m.69137 type:complete len:227 (+) Transcript_32178:103-783(+)